MNNIYFHKGDDYVITVGWELFGGGRGVMHLLECTECSDIPEFKSEAAALQAASEHKAWHESKGESK